MNDFDFYSPTYFVFGRGREAEAGEEQEEAGAETKEAVQDPWSSLTLEEIYSQD